MISRDSTLHQIIPPPISLTRNPVSSTPIGRLLNAKKMQELLQGLKKILCFEFAACFLPPSKRAKKRGKFKTKNNLLHFVHFVLPISMVRTFGHI